MGQKVEFMDETGLRTKLISGNLGFRVEAGQIKPKLSTLGALSFRGPGLAVS